MLNCLPEALMAVSPLTKGTNPEHSVRDLGKELTGHLNSIMDIIPSDYSKELRELLRKDSFDLSRYFNSLIDGTAIVSDNGRKILPRDSFDLCQERLREIQEFLKMKITGEEEKIK